MTTSKTTPVALFAFGVLLIIFFDEDDAKHSERIEKKMKWEEQLTSRPIDHANNERRPKEKTQTKKNGAMVFFLG